MNSARRDGEWVRAMRQSAPNAMRTIDQVIDYIAACPYPTVGAPGENMSYCNEGYAILSYVVDQVAGIPLEQFCMERIFRPLGMERTIMDDDCVGRAGHGRRQYYLSVLSATITARCSAMTIGAFFPHSGAGAMVKSTARDMAAYYRCLSNGGMHEGRQALPRAAVEAIDGPSIPASEIALLRLGAVQARQVRARYLRALGRIARRVHKRRTAVGRRLGIRRVVQSGRRGCG